MLDEGIKKCEHECKQNIETLEIRMTREMENKIT